MHAYAPHVRTQCEEGKEPDVGLPVPLVFEGRQEQGDGLVQS